MRLSLRFRSKRVLIPVVTVVGLVVVLVLLVQTSLLVLVVAGRGASNVPTIPCGGRYLAEGFTYHFRDPHRGEVVVIHARGHVGGPITPDSHARDLNLTKRVIGLPGDTVVGRETRTAGTGRLLSAAPEACPAHDSGLRNGGNGRN